MNMTSFRLALPLMSALALPALAHVTLETPRAAAGSDYKAVLRIGHGCEGSPTTTLRVQLPSGLRGAKPMPKPGWTLDIQRATLAQPYDSHGKTVTRDVVEISWRARSADAWLADDQYDEFALRGQVSPQAGGTLWFKVLQTCEKGQIDWAEVPAPGASADDLKSPAVGLEITPADAPAHHH